jgi:uncharacterized phiE125 gp8 family phage protein
MALTLVSGPDVEPITTADAKSHLRVDTAADDDYIDLLITVARRTVEYWRNEALITQTWKLVMDAFPGEDRLTLPKPPLQSITHVKYTPKDDSLTTFSSDSYIVDTDSDPGRLVLKSGESWPGDTLQIVNGVEITFVAGYGDAASDLPEELVHAMKLMVGHWYENREQVAVGRSAVTRAEEIPMGAQWLIWFDRKVPGYAGVTG